MFSIANMTAGYLDDPVMFVTSAMVAKGRVHQVDEQGNDNAPLAESVYGEETVAEGWCVTIRAKLATTRCLTTACRSKLGSTTKMKLLEKANRKVTRELHVTYLLRSLRATKGLLTEHLNLGSDAWK